MSDETTSAAEQRRWWQHVEIRAALLGVVGGIVAALVTVSVANEAVEQQRRADLLNAHQGALLRYQYDLQALGITDDDDETYGNADVDALLEAARISSLEAAATYKAAQQYVDRSPSLRRCEGAMLNRLHTITEASVNPSFTLEDVPRLMSEEKLGFNSRKPWETLDDMGIAVGDVRDGRRFVSIDCA